MCVYIGDQSHLIQNQWLVANSKIKVRKRDSHTHTHPTLDTQAHTSRVAQDPMCDKTWKKGNFWGVP